MIISQMGPWHDLAILLQFSGWLSLMFPNNTKPFITLISPLTPPQLMIRFIGKMETINQFANITYPLLVLFSHNKGVTLPI